MATSKYLRWLKEDELTTKVARRFAHFCAEDIEQRAQDEAFDADIYESAVRLVLDKLEGKDEVDNDRDNDAESDSNNGKDEYNVSAIKKGE